ncbi:hypothetical protein MF573_20365 [Klebsiella pneumoniae]|nr:hypothetical protein MF573_20365 [Klebsiella pneumoniae]
MILRFASGSFSPASADEETLLAFNVNNIETKVIAKHIQNLLCFVETQQAVVDEYASLGFYR